MTKTKTTEALTLAREALIDSRDDVVNTLNSYVDHPANARKRQSVIAQLHTHDQAVDAIDAALSAVDDGQARAALAELVACKDMKDEVRRLRSDPYYITQADRLEGEYEQRRDKAWDAARAALAAPAPDAGVRPYDAVQIENLEGGGLSITPTHLPQPVEKAVEADVRDALREFLDAQDALDNWELAGPNREDHDRVMRRRNVARRSLEAALASAPQADQTGEREAVTVTVEKMVESVNGVSWWVVLRRGKHRQDDGKYGADYKNRAEWHAAGLRWILGQGPKPYIGDAIYADPPAASEGEQP